MVPLSAPVGPGRPYRPLSALWAPVGPANFINQGCLLIEGVGYIDVRSTAADP